MSEQQRCSDGAAPCIPSRWAPRWRTTAHVHGVAERIVHTMLRPSCRARPSQQNMKELAIGSLRELLVGAGGERTAAAQPPATGRPAPQGAPIVILLQIVMLPHIEAHFPHLKSSAWPACQGQHAPSRGGKPPSAQLPLRVASFLDSPWSQHRGVAMAAISKTRKVRGRPGAHRSPPAGLGVSGRPSGPQCSPVGLCGAASMASPHALARSEPSGAQPLSVLAQGRRSAAGDAATRPAWAACRRRC